MQNQCPEKTVLHLQLFVFRIEPVFQNHCVENSHLFHQFYTMRTFTVLQHLPDRRGPLSFQARGRAKEGGQCQPRAQPYQHNTLLSSPRHAGKTKSSGNTGKTYSKMGLVSQGYGEEQACLLPANCRQKERMPLLSKSYSNIWELKIVGNCKQSRDNNRYEPKYSKISSFERYLVLEKAFHIFLYSSYNSKI